MRLRAPTGRRAGEAAATLVAAAEVLVVAVLWWSGRVSLGLGGTPWHVLVVAGAAGVATAVSLGGGPGGEVVDLVPLVVVLAVATWGGAGLVIAVPLAAGVAVRLGGRPWVAALHQMAACGAGVAVALAAFAAAGGRQMEALASWPAATVAGALCGAIVWIGRPLGANGRRLDPAQQALAAALGLVWGVSAVAAVVLGRSGPVAALLVAPAIVTAVVAVQVAVRHQRARCCSLARADAIGRIWAAGDMALIVRETATEVSRLCGGRATLCVAQGVPVAVVGTDPAAAGSALGSPPRSGDGAPVRNGEVPAWVATALGHTGGVAVAVAVDGAEGPSVYVAGGVDAGPGVTAAVEDVVEHAARALAAARRVEEAEEALRRQVDINRQKDEFLAAVSHELRTPLASMLGSVDTLRRLDGRMAEDARARFFTIAQRQGKRLQRLIEELLLTAALDQRQEYVVAAAADVGEILQEIAVDLAGQSGGRITVRVDGPLTVTTDGHKLRQILTNMAENATKFAPEGTIELTAVAAGPRVEIRVVDHGPGIAPQDRVRAFDRFVQLDGSSTRAQGGTGLGLYLCKRVADLLEADLRAAETPGGGATFVLSLPWRHSGACDPVGSGAGPARAPGGDVASPPGPARLERALLDLTRGPSSGPAASLAARPVVPRAVSVAPKS